MVWFDNKRPVEFARYRRAPFFLSGKYGWFFHVGDEHANLTTRRLADLLKEEKAYLVIDKEAWAKLVAKYRGEKAENPKVAKLEDEKKKRMLQAQKAAEEAKRRQAEAERKKRVAEQLQRRVDQEKKKAA